MPKMYARRVLLTAIGLTLSGLSRSAPAQDRRNPASFLGTWVGTRQRTSGAIEETRMTVTAQPDGAFRIVMSFSESGPGQTQRRNTGGDGASGRVEQGILVWRRATTSLGPISYRARSIDGNRLQLDFTVERDRESRSITMSRAS
jgi:hypothetical protein